MIYFNIYILSIKFRNMLEVIRDNIYKYIELEIVINGK